MSKCFNLHSEGEIVSNSKTSFAVAIRYSNRNIFDGGLPPIKDSGRVTCLFYEDRFGSVVDIEIDDQLISSGFGSVTLKDDNSVAVALKDHHTSIWEIFFEMKGVIPKYLLSQDFYCEETEQETTEETVYQENNQLMCQELNQSDNSASDNQHEQTVLC